MVHPALSNFQSQSFDQVPVNNSFWVQAPNGEMVLARAIAEIPAGNPVQVFYQGGNWVALPTGTGIPQVVNSVTEIRVRKPRPKDVGKVSPFYVWMAANTGRNVVTGYSDRKTYTLPYNAVFGDENSTFRPLSMWMSSARPQSVSGGLLVLDANSFSTEGNVPYFITYTRPQSLGHGVLLLDVGSFPTGLIILGERQDSRDMGDYRFVMSWGGGAFEAPPQLPIDTTRDGFESYPRNSMTASGSDSGANSLIRVDPHTGDVYLSGTRTVSQLFSFNYSGELVENTEHRWHKGLIEYSWGYEYSSEISFDVARDNDYSPSAYRNLFLPGSVRFAPTHDTINDQGDIVPLDKNFGYPSYGLSAYYTISAEGDDFEPIFGWRMERKSYWTSEPFRYNWRCKTNRFTWNFTRFDDSEYEYRLEGISGSGEWELEQIRTRTPRDPDDPYSLPVNEDGEMITNVIVDVRATVTWTDTIPSVDVVLTAGGHSVEISRLLKRDGARIYPFDRDYHYGNPLIFTSPTYRPDTNYYVSELRSVHSYYYPPKPHPAFYDTNANEVASSTEFSALQYLPSDVGRDPDWPIFDTDFTATVDVYVSGLSGTFVIYDYRTGTPQERQFPHFFAHHDELGTVELSNFSPYLNRIEWDEQVLQNLIDNDGIGTVETSYFAVEGIFRKLLEPEDVDFLLPYLIDKEFYFSVPAPGTTIDDYPRRQIYLLKGKITDLIHAPNVPYYKVLPEFNNVRVEFTGIVDPDSGFRASIVDRYGGYDPWYSKDYNFAFDPQNCASFVLLTYPLRFTSNMIRVSNEEIDILTPASYTRFLQTNEVPDSRSDYYHTGLRFRWNHTTALMSLVSWEYGRIYYKIDPASEFRGINYYPS